MHSLQIKMFTLRQSVAFVVFLKKKILINFWQMRQRAAKYVFIPMRISLNKSDIGWD